MLPDDIGHLVDVGSPTVSPDGQMVAWVVRRPDLDANRSRSAVWLGPADGSRPPRQVTAGEHGDGGPAWSPDGRLLAFTSRRSTGERRDATLHLLPVDGPGEVVTLTTQPEAITQLRWSPDGTRLAFACRRRTARFAAGDDDRARGPREVTRLLSMLDGEGWIVDRPTRIWVVPVDRSTDAVVVSGAAPAGVEAAVEGDAQGDHASPAWSPDGTRVAFVGGVTEDFDLDLRSRVLVAEVGGGAPTDGCEVVAVTDDAPLGFSDLAWSPDGTRLAALEHRTHHGPWNARLAVVDVATGAVTHPAGALDRNQAPYPGARRPVWEGDDLLFSYEDRGATPVARVAAAGGEVRVVAGADGCVLAQWDAAGGTLAATLTTPDRLPEVHVWPTTADATADDAAATADDAAATGRRLSRHTDAFHARCPPHPTERFTVASPVGDDDLDVWLVTPRDLDRTATHPVLLSVHGGPSTQYGDRWFDEFQLWASAGFCVVATNPHGSTGRTTGWLRTIRSPRSAVDPGRGWGGDDYDDVIAALDGALARYPFLDPERAGVLGGSYGGYMATWAVGHTDRFAAAVSERAVNDMLTLETTSDLMGLFRHDVGVDHLDDPDELRRMSPITYADAITTPMLLLHSDEDWRCPAEQADKLYLALRLRGREVRYLRFPEEGHELSRSGSPRHRVQRAQAIVDWFTHHLGTDAG